MSGIQRFRPNQGSFVRLYAVGPHVVACLFCVARRRHLGCGLCSMSPDSMAFLGAQEVTGQEKEPGMDPVFLEGCQNRKLARVWAEICRKRVGDQDQASYIGNHLSGTSGRLSLWGEGGGPCERGRDAKLRHDHPKP